MAQFETLNDIFAHATRSFSARPLFGTRRDGRWQWSTYAAFESLVTRLRAGLASLGVEQGDRVAIIANNRPEWAAVAYACFGLGAAIVPMYEAQKASEWEFIVRDSGAKVVVAATDAIVQRVRPLLESAENLAAIVSLDDKTVPDRGPLGVRGFSDVCNEGEPRAFAVVLPTDTACVLYTSGTTGQPKGVLLSHRNIASNVTAIHQVFDIAPDDRSLSFLPWAHSFGQVAELHALFSLGASLALIDNVETLLASLLEVQPTVLVSVPRVFNKLYVSVQQQLLTAPSIVRALVGRGVRARSFERKGVRLSLFDRAVVALSDRVVFAKVRARFGGKLRFVVSGGAALGREVAEFIDALGIAVYEGYGLTETSPIVAANGPRAHRIGSVGKVIPGVRVEVSPEGEVVVYGPNVMQGYRNNPAANDAVFTGDGGFRTGDLGRVDSDGFLFITGRIKEQYKLENGKYVVPTPLEEKLKLSPYVLNTMVYGDNRPFNVALVVANVPAVRTWAEQRGVGTADADKMLASPEVRALFDEELRRLGESFKGFEVVREFALISEDFSTDNGLLTPSLKVKRAAVLARYGAVIDALYARRS